MERTCISFLFISFYGVFSYHVIVHPGVLINSRRELLTWLVSIHIFYFYWSFCYPEITIWSVLKLFTRETHAILVSDGHWILPDSFIHIFHHRSSYFIICKSYIVCVHLLIDAIFPFSIFWPSSIFIFPRTFIHRIFIISCHTIYISYHIISYIL